MVSVLALGPIACGGTGDSASGGTTGAGGSGSTTSSGSNSTSGTGVGGGASTSSTSGTAATSSASGSGTTGAGGGNACSGYIDLTENNEVKMHFPSICMGSWGSNETMTAVGYHFAGGAAPGADEIDIHGCATTGAGSAGLLLRTPKVTAPGTFLDGDASYTDAAGVQLSSSADPYKIVITKLDPPGGVIEGTFDVTVTSPTDAKKTLVGSFHVCRVADENVP
ncbi:MAG: hypothetical protein ABJE95_02155 [Byssovorax sp.]